MPALGARAGAGARRRTGGARRVTDADGAAVLGAWPVGQRGPVRIGPAVRRPAPGAGAGAAGRCRRPAAGRLRRAEPSRSRRRPPAAPPRPADGQRPQPDLRPALPLGDGPPAVPRARWRGRDPSAPARVCPVDRAGAAARRRRLVRRQHPGSGGGAVPLRGLPRRQPGPAERRPAGRRRRVRAAGCVPGPRLLPAQGRPHLGCPPRRRAPLPGAVGQGVAVPERTGPAALLDHAFSRSVSSTGSSGSAWMSIRESAT